MQVEFNEEISQWIDWDVEGLKLKKDAPDEIKKEFNKTMKIVKDAY